MALVDLLAFPWAAVPVLNRRKESWAAPVVSLHFTKEANIFLEVSENLDLGSFTGA